MLTLKHLKLIDRTGEYIINGMIFYVKIKDVKSSYGNIRVLIEPLQGNGNSWVNLDSINLSDSASSL